MRLVGNIESEELAQRFSHFLKKEKIEATVDKEEDTKGNILYLIWIHDEDKISKAQTLFETFKNNPKDSKYDVWIQPKEEFIQETMLPLKKRVVYILTPVLIAICSFVYFLNLMQEISLSKHKPAAVITPIQLLLFYDVPDSILKLSELLKEYPLESFKEPSQDLKQKIENIDQMPQWKGLYIWLLHTIQGKEKEPLAPMFIKIRQGQIWRVFSPCILHTAALHLLFNMLWLWVLGRQIEERVKKWKIVCMILFTGILSNTLQYLVSGPLFLGFSGVVVAMAGFIWARQKVAPWEGYALNKSTFLFLAIFVFGMLALQIGLFIFQSIGYDFALNIANTAHIVGGISGYLLGKSSWFSMEIK